MDKPDDRDIVQATPLDQGPKIPNPIPMGATKARAILALLTEDEIAQAVARGDKKYQKRLQAWKEQRNSKL